MHLVQSPRSLDHMISPRHRQRRDPPVRHKSDSAPDIQPRCAMSGCECFQDYGYQESLSVWNQCAPRVYLCVVLCFPFDNERREGAVQHIHHALRRLAAERPIFASRLHPGQHGKIIIGRSRAHSIPFEVADNIDDGLSHYGELRDEEFPPARFIHSRFGIPGGMDPLSPRPVSKVQAAFTNGGLLLSIYLHHSLADGASLRVFLESFGNATRDITSDLPSDQKLRIPGVRSSCTHSHKLLDTSAFKRLMTSCPEYTTLPDLSGPTQPRFYKVGTPISEIDRVGKIFVFKTEQLQELRELIKEKNESAERPTAYTSLAALAFAHITEAQTNATGFLDGIEPSPYPSLWNSVNWRTRAFPGATDDYFGNAALPVLTKASREQLIDVCRDDRALAQLAIQVRQSIDAVDEDHVSRRMAMMAQAPDPRILGVNYDPRSPECLAFNTWRHFGADVEWNIPGVSVTKPDAIRRASGGWNMGSALILPARADSTQQELFVSLSVDAMRLLCQDERWMRWVDRVIG
ncbi:hypothetical protein F5Y16DRAFT_360197 [Xylariaceae sp. FL0255]|nr:hypothetical protein F5Y16DRAFT_360197 [Xylariaceae sp. FL0255]